MYKTPRDVLEHLYRDALVKADALGISWLDVAIAIDDRQLRIELIQYYNDEYGQP